MSPIQPSSLGDGLRIEPAERPDQVADPSSFGDALGKAIGSVDQLQVAADHQASALADGAGNLHETSIALSKAEISMHFLTRVRNKFVDAYQDIMKMSV